MSLYRLIKQFERVRYRRGNIVYRKGEVCKNLYIVYDGEFELIKTIQIKDDVKEKVSDTKQLFSKALEKLSSDKIVD